ncbi:MAG: diaminopimelate decarboxylase [Chloroflexi bacterium 13_1_40CM_67_9]|nr:MAG: diaminopimelate decarboxylase [Chloroflexi bacterium 13_1_40CM_67_9]
MIEPAIWPLRTAVGRNGHVRIGTHDLAALADQYGTPLYVYDAETIRASLREYVDAFFRYRPVRVAYSVKACALLGVAAVIAREGVDASVASLGELEAARRAGFPAARMELHGNAKPDDEVAGALTARVGRFVVDGAHDIERLARLTHGRRRPQAVWLRVAPGIEVETHPHLVTGTIDSKFGAPISTGEALAQAREIARAKGLALIGIHAHIGAQVRDARPYGELARALVAFANEVRAATGASITELGMGGGVAVRLRSTEEAPDLDDYARAVTGPVRKDRALRGATVYVEPGRGLVGRAAVALYRVVGTKRVPGVRTFVAVDGGMGDNIRPALYGAEYSAVLAARASEKPTEGVTVAGRYCESGDVLIRSVFLPTARSGDVLAIPAAGAYSVAMSSNYNETPRPAVILLDGGGARVIRDRESVADIWRLERR